MSKQLDDLLEKYAWNALQIQQLRLADKKGFDLSLYHPKYDWEQLRELRLAQENGLEPTFLADEHIDSTSMKRTREEIYRASGMYERNKEETRNKKQKRIIVLSIFLLSLFGIAVLAFLNEDLIIGTFSSLQLQLVSNKYEIGISELGNFAYSDLVKKYSEDCELVLPNVEIDDIGEYTLKYTIKNEAKEKSKTLLLVVYDDVAPTLSLKTTTISLKYAADFNEKDYISSATDNVDGNIIDKVNITSNVNTTSPKTYTVTYSVTDSAKNKTEKEMKVVVKEKETSTSSNSSNSSTGTSNNSSNNTSSSSSSSTTSTTKLPKPSNQIYRIKDYNYSIADCKSAAESYMNSIVQSGKYNVAGARMEQYVEDSVIVGYQVIFY